MLFYKRSTRWKYLRGIRLVPMDATCWVSWLEGSSWRPFSMHCLPSFTFVTFLILWSLSPAASSVSWYRPCLVCSGLAYEICSGGGPSTYVYCVVCYRVIVAPYVSRTMNHKPMQWMINLLTNYVTVNVFHLKRVIYRSQSLKWSCK